ncbi:MAG: hypothetical protein ABEK50_18230 [bacterium]
MNWKKYGIKIVFWGWPAPVIATIGGLIYIDQTYRLAYPVDQRYAFGSSWIMPTVIGAVTISLIWMVGVVLYQLNQSREQSQQTLRNEREKLNEAIEELHDETGRIQKTNDKIKAVSDAQVESAQSINEAVDTFHKDLDEYEKAQEYETVLKEIVTALDNGNPEEVGNILMDVRSDL